MMNAVKNSIELKKQIIQYIIEEQFEAFTGRAHGNETVRSEATLRTVRPAPSRSKHCPETPRTAGDAAGRAHRCIE